MSGLGLAEIATAAAATPAAHPEHAAATVSGRFKMPAGLSAVDVRCRTFLHVRNTILAVMRHTQRLP